MSINTTGDLIRLALRSTGVTGVGQSPTADDATDCLAFLTMLVAQWQRKRWLVWDLADTAVVSTGAASYTVGLATPILGPATFGLFPVSYVGLAPGTVWNDGGTLAIIPGGSTAIWPALVPGVISAGTNGAFAVARPDRIESAFARLLPSGGGLAVDFPLGIIESREDYNEIGLKGLSTFPSAVFYDSAFPVGLLYFWPIPAAGQFELHIATKASLPVYTYLTDLLNVPPEYIEAMLYSLAVRISMNYGQQPNPGHVAALRASLNTLRQANTQIATLDMPAGVTGRRGGSGVAASASPAFQSGGW